MKLKFIIPIFIISLLTLACKQDSGQDSPPAPAPDLGTGNVLIELTNSTGFDLKDIQLMGREIGSLAINKKTPFYKFEDIRVHGERPEVGIVCKIEGIEVTTFLKCGMGSVRKLEGTYELDLISVILPSDNIRYIDYKL